jgi:hypothetical protein
MMPISGKRRAAAKNMKARGWTAVLDVEKQMLSGRRVYRKGWKLPREKNIFDRLQISV